MNFVIFHGNFVLHVPKVFRETSTVKFLERQVLLSFWRQVLLSKSSEGKNSPAKMFGEMIGPKMIGGWRKNSPAKMIGEVIGPK